MDLNPSREEHKRRRSSAAGATEPHDLSSPTKLKSTIAKSKQHASALENVEVHEDPYGDDFESEDVWENESDDENSETDETDASPTKASETTADSPTSGSKNETVKRVGIQIDGTRIFRPGVDSINDDEKLDYDPKAYEMLHRFTLEWPALSFDVLPDNLGAIRRVYPHTMFVAAGTQGETSSAGPSTGNKVFIMKWSRMMRTNKDGDELSDDDEDSSDEENDEETDEDAIEASVSFHHPGAVNRIRVCPQDPNVCATWSDRAKVFVWDLTDFRNRLENKSTPIDVHKRPLKVSEDDVHSAEGYALSFSPTSPGRFLTGDCNGVVALWEVAEGGWRIGSKWREYESGVSVEGLEWNPHVGCGQGGDCFAAAATNGTIRLFDARSKKPTVTIKGHESEVNEVTWNPVQEGLLLSAADDGVINVWDTRMLADAGGTASAQALTLVHLKWHKKAITSARWHPTDEAMFAVASADDSISIWDLSVEPEDDEEKLRRSAGADKATESAASGITHFPSQLMFHHLGQREIKEVQWHSNIPGVLVSTASEGFNIFKPCNM